MAFHAHKSRLLSFSNARRENFPGVACFSGTADFHIPAAALLVGNYYQDAERENIVAFVRCSSAIKKERPFSCFLFPRSLFFSFLRILSERARAPTIFPAERNVNILRALLYAARLRCAVVAAFFH